MAPAFRHVAIAFFVIMLGSTLPTPLYPLYQLQLGFSNATITVIYAVYAGGVLTALLLFGRISDVIGRRRTLLPGIACAALSAGAFLVADHIAWLVVGRILSGLSAGLFTGTATATLVDLAGRERADRATLIATVANMTGLGAGPLVSGLLVTIAPRPLLVPYAAHLVMLAIVVIGVWRMPEPVAALGRPRLTVTLPTVPPEVRATFVRSAIAGFAGFAVLGLFAAVAPAILRGVFELTEPAIIGGAVCAIFVASAAGQIFGVRPLGSAALPVGCGVLTVGALLLAAGLATGSRALLVGALLIAGAGQGVSFRAGLGAINAKAPANMRGEIASTFFFVLYIAISLPVIGAGVAADRYGLRAAGVGFSFGVAALAATALIALLRAGAPKTQ